MLCTAAINTSNTTRQEHRPVPPNANPAVWILIRVVVWFLEHSTKEAYMITKSDDFLSAVKAYMSQINLL